MVNPPLAMLAELTHRCPLMCPYCSNPVELARKVFDRLWPIDDWVRLAISSEKFQLNPWGLEGELADWMMRSPPSLRGSSPSGGDRLVQEELATPWAGRPFHAPADFVAVPTFAPSSAEGAGSGPDT